jgi:hypothetical protein
MYMSLVFYGIINQACKRKNSILFLQLIINGVLLSFFIEHCVVLQDDIDTLFSSHGTGTTNPEFSPNKLAILQLQRQKKSGMMI